MRAVALQTLRVVEFSVGRTQVIGTAVIGSGSSGSGTTDLTWTAATSTVASSTGTDAVITAVDGSNPGLMTVAQKTKLDGIETAATADQSAAEILAALVTVDGTGSGLDADLLDGQSSAYYATATSVSDHTGDTTDAHDASAISFTPNGSIAATDVQAAIQEVRDEAAGSTDLSWDAATSVVASSTGTDATLTAADGSNPGLMTSAQFTKLAGIETAADVTDATNVAAAGAHMSGGTDVPVTDGGTGASTAAAARTNLDVDQAGDAFFWALALG